MDFSDGNSGSEDELDVQELEVALYSQIHHDNGDSAILNTKPVFHYNHITLPLRVGIKELPTRITPIVRKQPMLGENFLAFSNDEIVDNESTTEEKKQYEPDYEDDMKLISAAAEPCEKAKVDEKDVQKGEKKKGDKLTALNNKSEESSQLTRSKGMNRKGDEILESDSRQQSKGNASSVGFGSLEENDCSEEKIVYSKLTTGNKSKSETKLFGKRRKQKEKRVRQQEEKKLLLPFSVTNVKNRLHAQDTTNTLAVPVPLKNKTADSTKLEEFLELARPREDSSILKFEKKKKPLNKFDVAVKPREPSVHLRRGPYVAVRYKQDSDTNTDYSDSETSSNTSPVKVKTVSTPSNQEGPVSSQDNVPKTVRENETVVQGYSRKADSEKISREEDSLSNETNPQTVSESVSIDDGDASEAADGTSDSESSDESESESSSQDTDNTSDSESSQSSDPEDFLSDVNPNLDFNLDGGVERLLATPNAVANRWKIDEKDRYNMNSLLNRYFSPKSLQCRNCKGDGHLSRDCPQPMKRPCIFCGIEGHEYKACPNAICFNCDAPGHRNTECREPKRRWNVCCDRCWMPGHEERVCPDRWRQYHITVKPKSLITTSKTAQNPLVFCYNCGKKGHLGYECTAPRMNQYVAASYPFIAQYDTKRKRQQDQGQQRRAEQKDHRKGGCRHKGTEHDEYSMGRVDRGDRRHGSRSQGEQPLKRKNKKHKQIEDHGHSKRRTENDSDSRERKKVKTDHHNMPVKEKQTKGMSKRKNSSTWNQGENSVFGSESRSRSRPGKREVREEGEITEEEDFYDDLESHQVNNNEWWKKRDKSSKQRKKKSSWKPPRSSDTDWRRNERYLADHARLPGLRDGNFHRSGHKREGVDHRHRDDGPSSSKRFKHSAPGFGKNQGSMKHFPSSENLKVRFHNRQISANDRNFPQGRLKHSLSWPVLQNTSGNRKGNRNGFQVQNQRFISMKQNCDITVNLRK